MIFSSSKNCWTCFKISTYFDNDSSEQLEGVFDDREEIDGSRTTTSVGVIVLVKKQPQRTNIYECFCKEKLCTSLWSRLQRERASKEQDSNKAKKPLYVFLEELNQLHLRLRVADVFSIESFSFLALNSENSIPCTSARTKTNRLGPSTLCVRQTCPGVLVFAVVVAGLAKLANFMPCINMCKNAQISLERDYERGEESNWSNSRVHAIAWRLLICNLKCESNFECRNPS